MNIEHNQKRRYERKRNELSRVGPVRCTICGKEDARCLEAHHVAGRANADDLVVLCRNCHAVQSDRQEDWPSALLAHREKGEGEKIAAMLMGLAELVEEFARFIVQKLRELADWLAERAPNLALPGEVYVSG